MHKYTWVWISQGKAKFHLLKLILGELHMPISTFALLIIHELWHLGWLTWSPCCKWLLWTYVHCQCSFEIKHLLQYCCDQRQGHAASLNRKKLTLKYFSYIYNLSCRKSPIPLCEGRCELQDWVYFLRFPTHSSSISSYSVPNSEGNLSRTW